jgi:hypothetical protein
MSVELSEIPLESAIDLDAQSNAILYKLTLTLSERREKLI